MGKTYRYNKHYFRNPKGKKNAIINGARKKAIPPDEWDDVSPSAKDIFFSVNRMAEKEMPKEEIVKKIKNKADKAGIDLPLSKIEDRVNVIIERVENNKRWKITKENKKKSIEDWFFEEKNAEVRREIIRKFGLERIVNLTSKSRLKIGDGRVLDKKGTYELWQVRLTKETYGHYLKMENPSLPDVWHLEGVPGDIETVKSALKWRNHGLENDPEILT